MSYDHQPVSPVFRIDVSAEPEATQPPGTSDRHVVDLLQQLVISQQKQTELLEVLVKSQNAANQQRANELQQWKEENPVLAEKCHAAAETLSRVQTEFLDSLTEEIQQSEDYLVDGDYMLNEFVDRFGPRMAHLNGVLQMLAQLSHDPQAVSS